MADLTVLIPVFNARDYLLEAIRSVVDDAPENCQIIAVDDGSTDGSREILNTIEDDRVRVYLLDHQGLGAALNFGIEQCETEFLARMDADDISIPGRFDAQLGFLRQHSEVGIVGTQFRYFGVGGLSPVTQSLPTDHLTIYNDLLHGKLAMVHASLMFRTEVLKKVGGYRVRGMGEDWDLFLRLAEVTRFANLAVEYYLWRLHPSNLSSNRIRHEKLAIEWACTCARNRRAGLAEPKFAEFISPENDRSMAMRLVEWMDTFSIFQYRTAMTRLVGGHKIQGYLRLGIASAFSPGRTVKRLRRIVRGRSPNRG